MKEIMKILEESINSSRKVKLDDDLKNDLGLSSIAMLTILCQIEEKLHVEFKMMDFVNVKTVQDLISVIQLKITL